jgi:glucose 1-dehydrogenase
VETSEGRLIMQRTALVTGSSNGIGFASVTEFLKTGHRVFGVDISSGPCLEGLEFIKADVASQNEVEKALKHVGDQTDHIDVLVNNAGVGFSGRVEQTVFDQWNRVLAVNLTGPFLVTQAALPLLRQSHSGSVVNVASVHALGTSKAVAAYAASKGGLVSLTRALALELAEYGIRVNCILPGAVRTSMLLGVPGRSDFDHAAVGKRLEHLAARTPLKKIGSPEEIAKAICFLGSPGASFITGQTLVVDGGALARLSTE